MEGPACDFVLNPLMVGVGSLHGGAGFRHSSPASPHPIRFPHAPSQPRPTQPVPAGELDGRNACSPMEGPARDFVLNPFMVGVGSLHGGAGFRHSSPPSPYPIRFSHAPSQPRPTQSVPAGESDGRNACSPMEGPAGHFVLNALMAGAGSLHGGAWFRQS
jgi:hypothetical protein